MTYQDLDLSRTTTTLLILQSAPQNSSANKSLSKYDGDATQNRKMVEIGQIAKSAATSSISLYSPEG
jgi:hypothetical protein